MGLTAMEVEMELRMTPAYVGRAAATDRSPGTPLWQVTKKGFPSRSGSTQQGEVMGQVQHQRGKPSQD